MNLQQTAFAIYELMKSFSILKITNCMTRLRLQLNTEDIANLPLKKLKNIMKLILNQYVISICVQNSFYSCENCPVLN